MRKFTFLFAFLFVVLGLSAQTNLVKNPSFESDFADWAKGPVNGYTEPVVKSSGAQNGTKYVEYVATATTGFYQDIAITGGKNYVVSFWYKATGDNTDARIWSNFKDAANTIVYLNSTTTDDPLRNNNVYLPPASSWTKHEVAFTAPANVVLFQLHVRAYTGSTVAYDNFSLVEAGGTPVSATPTITPASGNITGPTAVTITAAAGASIYYTTNGSEPTNASTAYTAPFNVSATTTVKAIAYETGKNPSSVATATYTLVTANTVANIAALRAITLPSTEVYKLTGEAVLTLKSATRNAKYIQDATGAIVIDDASGKITTNYNLGDGITGITGTLALFQNMLQFTPIGDPGAATSTGKTITPLSVNLGDITSDHQAKLVKVSGLTISDIDGGTGLFVASKSYNLNGGTNPVLRTQYADQDYIGATIPTAPQTIVGVVLVYGTTIQLVPRSLADISTGVSKTRMQDLSVWTAAGKINFNAAAGEMVEVYNTLGQRLYNAAATEGQNQVQVSLKGVAIVKVGNRVGKVIL